jgi:long-chain acyl-CoA synthetase
VLVHGLLGATASRASAQRALIAEDRDFTYGDVDGTSDRLARVLQEHGIRRGDRVAVLMDNSPELVIALFAILKAGGAFVPVSTSAKLPTVEYIVDDSGARVLLTNERLAGRAAQTGFPHCLRFEDADTERGDGPTDPGLIDADLAAIIYTSGSTGTPKGVMLTHRNLTHSAWAIATYLEATADDVVLCTLPLAYSYGICQVLVGAQVGYTLLLERSFAYPFDVMQRIERHHVTTIPGVPTMFARMLEMAPFEHLDLSNVRCLTNAAAALSPSHIERLAGAFPEARIFCMYGMTECTRIAYLDPARLFDKSGSVGKAMPNIEAYVVDDGGHRAAPFAAGELVVRGASVMRGYWHKPVETARTLRPGEIDAELILHTGDLFSTDNEGFLFFVGRADDVFKCRGEKVCPTQVEHVLYELAAVGEAAVIGVPDEVDGMAVKAIVAPSGIGGLDEQAIRRHCRAKLEEHMMPKYVEIRESLPKTGSGKIEKVSLA